MDYFSARKGTSEKFPFNYIYIGSHVTDVEKFLVVCFIQYTHLLNNIKIHIVISN